MTLGHTVLQENRDDHMSQRGFPQRGNIPGRTIARHMHTVRVREEYLAVVGRRPDGDEGGEGAHLLIARAIGIGGRSGMSQVFYWMLVRVGRRCNRRR